MAVRPDAEIDEELTGALRVGGQRVTLPRLMVYRHLQREPARHVTAEQLHSEIAANLPSLSLATVYSTLDLLDGLGLMRRLSTPGGSAVYDSRVDEHHHAVCRSCGAIVDLDARVRMNDVATAAQRAGFRVEHTEVQVAGTCASCSA